MMLRRGSDNLGDAQVSYGSLENHIDCLRTARGKDNFRGSNAQFLGYILACFFNKYLAGTAETMYRGGISKAVKRCHHCLLDLFSHRSCGRIVKIDFFFSTHAVIF